MKLYKWDEILKPGTPIWVITYSNREVKVKCPVCKGKGKVKLEGKEYECPECFGHGWNGKLEPEKWQVRDGYMGDFWVVTRTEIEQVKSAPVDKYKVMYWCNCNGFPAEVCFTSKNLATRACNKLNEKIKEKKGDLVNL